MTGIEAAMRRAWLNMVRTPERRRIELHAPSCPKITSNETALCTCGGSPLETALAADLAEAGPR